MYKKSMPNAFEKDDALGEIEENYDTKWVAKECEWFEKRLILDPGLNGNSNRFTVDLSSQRSSTNKSSGLKELRVLGRK